MRSSSATIDVLDEVVDHEGPWRIGDKHVLRLFLATVRSGEPVAGSDHDQIRWLRPMDLDTVNWLCSDQLALPAVRQAVVRLLAQAG